MKRRCPNPGKSLLSQGKGAGLIFLFAAVSLGAETPDAETILRRADQVINPYQGLALDIELSAVSRSTGRKLRDSHFTMLTHRNGRTLMLLHQGDALLPGALLITEHAYWLWLPTAEKPIELPFQYISAGDLSHAGFLRLNLRSHFKPVNQAEAWVDGKACWLLALEPRRESAFLRTVRYWVSKSGFLPVRIEFYAEAEAPLKTVIIADFQETGLGPRPAKIVIEDGDRQYERVVLTLGKPQGVKTSSLEFGLEDLAALREAARQLIQRGGLAAEGTLLAEELNSLATLRFSSPR